jgi:hypothetical protein
LGLAGDEAGDLGLIGGGEGEGFAEGAEGLERFANEFKA